MEEFEIPLETVQENTHHATHGGGEHGDAGRGWLSYAALSSAIIAVCAAVAALLAGQHANEAMIDQIKSANDWNYYQAKGVKSAVLQSKIETLIELGKPASPEDSKKMDEYKKQQAEISDQAKEHNETSEHHLKIHELIARAVTMFQVAIALGAVSILSRKRRFFLGSLGLAAVGIFFFIQGLLA
jgi:hypothetical protein